MLTSLSHHVSQNQLKCEVFAAVSTKLVYVHFLKQLDMPVKIKKKAFPRFT
jgi:hypothetical protein